MDIKKSKTVQQWLLHQFGEIPNMKTLPDKAKDGYFICQLLRNYGLISKEDLDLIHKNQSISIAYANFKNHIMDWLEDIDVDLEEDDLVDIVQGKELAAMRLLYDMYLRLEDVDSRLYIPRKRKKRNRQGIEEEKPSKVEAEYAVESLDLIDIRKRRLKNLMMHCREERQHYYQSLRLPKGALSLDFEKCDCPCECLDFKEKKSDILPIGDDEKDLSFDELVEQQEKSKMNEFRPSLNEAKRIIGEIKDRVSKNVSRKILGQQLQCQLLDKAWYHIEKTYFEKPTCDRLAYHMCQWNK